ncbi:hypothetical protein HFO17_12050 [Rhizobium laguerreae]|uniref:hypothetical protein n=1 Tax=Rhizobium laguerreae TaxID=1076926 RepID=UPI001C91F955|nr:hypothetical protein [Rhizobium laguerreae]MBY3235269.1 hypothetical protein [Rhizobium laguerreae]
MQHNLKSRDIWTHGGGWPLPDLLRSALASLLILAKQERAAYFASPWITDFELFDNRFRDFAALFPRAGEEPWVRFSDYLAALSGKFDVRIITTENDRSEAFANIPVLKKADRVTFRTTESKFHEKGILAPVFYIEGSMNITNHGVRVRGEKVIYHSGSGKNLPEKIAGAYLEFDRHWKTLV